jgi:hypothetical protein
MAPELLEEVITAIVEIEEIDVGVGASPSSVPIVFSAVGDDRASPLFRKASNGVATDVLFDLDEKDGVFRWVSLPFEAGLEVLLLFGTALFALRSVLFELGDDRGDTMLVVRKQ